MIYAGMLLAFMLCGPSVMAAEPSAAKAPPPAVEERFDIMEYRIEGNAQLSVLAIERAVTPYLGPQRRVKDVEAARDALAKAYGDAGYPTVLVDIPEQDVEGGVISLRVVPGRVDQLKVSGARYFSQGRLRAEVPSLATGRVPYLPQVQKELNAANTASNDRQITPVLKPGATPGALDVELKVKDRLPLHGALELTDRRSPNTERLRLSARVSYDNLFQRAHSLALQYLAAPQQPDQAQVYSATYVLRPFVGNTRLAFYGVKSESDVASLGDLNVLGEGTIAGARAIVPLAAPQQLFHSLNFGIDYKDFKENLLLQGADSINTPIEYLHFSALYSLTRPAERHTTRFNAGAHFGLRGLNDERIDCEGERIDQFQCKRSGAQPNYLYLQSRFEHEALLWKDSVLRARVEGQLAHAPLISNEQYAAGGADSVRGYFESQALGDDGLSGGLEWRTWNLAGAAPALTLNELRGLGFIEGAALRLREALPAQDDRFNLASTGLGLRARLAEYINLELDYAWPFKDQGEIDSGDGRAHFLLGVNF